MEFLSEHFNDQTAVVQMAIGLVLLACAAFFARFVVASALRKALGSLRDRTQTRLLKTFLDERILARAAQIVPSLVVQLGINLVPHLPATPYTIIRNVAFALTALHFVRTITMALNVIQERSLQNDPSHKFMAIKSTVQLINIVLYGACTILIIAVLIDRSPVIVLSGMGAMSAVLMLVFKDTILSFTAGILIASNDMLRVGDWIEMPQAGADGDVVDISLHTIKVQNWDKTITTIPTWKLVSESYKNWRGMQASGGRRIKRSIRIDAGTVRFLTNEEIARLSSINLIHDYLEDKRHEVQSSNEDRRHALGALAELPANQRRLTNIGTFRAYALAYLKHHPGIHQDMTLMVRQMEPTPEGIPMELYCFTNSTAWVAYEGYQSDIFDHLLAILPELGLRAFQNPSGADMRAMLTGLGEAIAQRPAGAGADPAKPCEGQSAAQ